MRCSDTRGSIRGPAALCGIAGFKPTASRVPREGAFPLSTTLDSVGPLANSLACCAAYDAVLSGEAAGLPEMPVKGLRLMLPRSSALEDLDAQVAKAFDDGLKKLSKSGAVLTEIPVPAFDRQDAYFRGGGYAAAESYHVHRRYLDRLAQPPRRSRQANDPDAVRYRPMAAVRPRRPCAHPPRRRRWWPTPCQVPP